MTKLYFLSPDKQSATSTISELKAQGVTPKDISILAHEKTGFDTSLDLAELSKHNVSDFGKLGMSDLIPALEKGAAVGGGLGLIGGLAAMTFPITGLIIGGGAVLASTAVGAGLGAWTSSLIGISAPHHEIEEYIAAVENGDILLLVDVADGNAEEIKTIISKYHPEIEIKESSILPIDV